MTDDTRGFREWVRCASALSAVTGVLLLSSAATAQNGRCRHFLPRLLGAQATAIGQILRPFRSPYAGPMSLRATGDRQATDSYGVYTGVCLTSRVAVYVDAEMIRGNGISNVTGLAGLTNGDALRQGSVDLGQGPYLARAFLRWTVPLPSRGQLDPDRLQRGADQLPGVVPGRRLEITAGKLALSDIFDLSRYANSTRTQFLDWVLFNNGAWDFAADTRGYSNGIAIAWITPRWTLRAGSFQMPTLANGNVFDPEIGRARGDDAELTLTPPGGAVVRLLAYVNHGRMGRYSVATALGGATGARPDIVADDAPGRVKFGFGLSAELPLADDGDTGLFGRLGWNDGHTESFVFTEADRHASAGLQLSGRRWRRSADVVGIALAADGLSAPHRDYLAAGGLGFLLGDGALSYGLEIVTEAYYRLQLGPHLAVSPDVIHSVNPGYNRVRGPATVLGLRVRASL